jgi:hypothetical protein
MERRSLADAVTSVPDTDSELVHQFVTQERRTPKPEPAERSRPREQQLRHNSASEQPHNGSSSVGVMPVGLIPVTVRLRPEIAGALKRASLERQLSGEAPFTQQDLVEQALEPWLRSEGYLG